MSEPRVPASERSEKRESPPDPRAGVSDIGTATPDPGAARPPARPFYRRPMVLALLAVLVVVAAVFGIRYLIHARGHESTDDAFIEGRIVQISPKVAGHVVRVDVADNEMVASGQRLVELDRRDFEAKVAQARAQVVAAEAAASSAAADDARIRALYGRQLVARQELDHGVAAARTTAAQLEVARKALAQAELDLSYTTMVAPEAGRVTRRSVEVGMFVQVGQALMAIVPPEFWVIANFKETQLTRLRPGQPVEIRVDAYRGKRFQGHVDSIQSGTGARFSLLPPENATGNFVKVVQRVPVKILFDEAPDPAFPLGPGMSVVPDVRVR